MSHFLDYFVGAGIYFFGQAMFVLLSHLRSKIDS